MSKANHRKEILTRFTREVWSEGSIEASDKYIAPKYTIHHDPGDPWEKKELDPAGYKERVKKLREAFPDQCFDIQGLFEEGEAVVMTWLWSATHKGDIPGFPAQESQSQCREPPFIILMRRIDSPGTGKSRIVREFFTNCATPPPDRILMRNRLSVCSALRIWEEGNCLCRIVPCRNRKSVNGDADKQYCRDVYRGVSSRHDRSI